MIVFLFIFYAYHSLQQDYIGCVFINILRNNDEKRGGANQKIPLVVMWPSGQTKERSARPFPPWCGDQTDRCCTPG